MIDDSARLIDDSTPTPVGSGMADGWMSALRSFRILSSTIQRSQTTPSFPPPKLHAPKQFRREDMSRLLRRSASVFLVLFALVAVEARAGSSYLFGATEEDIDATMRYYFPKGYDRDAAFRQMSAPFDCRNFGDLCREVGEDYAYRMVEIVWQKAKRQTPLDMIARATEQQYDDLSLRRFESLYPEGVDDRDPYWGVVAAAGTPTPCED